MPAYWQIRKLKQRKWRERIIDNILRLRAHLREQIPERTVTQTLLIATWNIRDFGARRFNPRKRTKEALFYLAEIISAFDIIAVQEVNRDMKQLEDLMNILSYPWTYICTDVTEGSGGNQERMAFIYDRSKVRFRNIAGEIVLPRTQLIDRDKQFARTPFLASFQSGWLRFNLCTVHLYYGSESSVGLSRRIAEIKGITKILAKKAKQDDVSYIVLGDFNIIGPKDKTMEALLTNGFEIPDSIWGMPSTPFSEKHYDQIAFRSEEGKVRFGDRGGTFNFYDSVFRDDEAEIFIRKYGRDFEKYGDPQDEERMNDYYLKRWRTWQMSDHLPMWIELEIDFTDNYLDSLK